MVSFWTSHSYTNWPPLFGLGFCGVLGVTFQNIQIHFWTKTCLTRKRDSKHSAVSHALLHTHTQALPRSCLHNTHQNRVGSPLPHLNEPQDITFLPLSEENIQTKLPPVSGSSDPGCSRPDLCHIWQQWVFGRKFLPIKSSPWAWLDMDILALWNVTCYKNDIKSLLLMSSFVLLFILHINL